jgi:hypothetical protein
MLVALEKTKGQEYPKKKTRQLAGFYLFAMQLIST